jgi:hypothetical protein
MTNADGERVKITPADKDQFRLAEDETGGKEFQMLNADGEWEPLPADTVTQFGDDLGIDPPNPDDPNLPELPDQAGVDVPAQPEKPKAKVGRKSTAEKTAGKPFAERLSRDDGRLARSAAINYHPNLPVKVPAVIREKFGNMPDLDQQWAAHVKSLHEKRKAEAAAKGDTKGKGGAPKKAEPAANETAMSRRRAVGQYTASNEFFDLNARLREGKPLNKKQSQIAERLRAEFAKEPVLSEPKKVFRHMRGMNEKQAADFLSKIKSADGKPVQLGGFLSTSTDQDYADRQGGLVQLQIDAVHGMDVESESRHGAEREFLLPDDSRFVVESVGEREIPGTGKKVSLVKLRQLKPGGDTIDMSWQPSKTRTGNIKAVWGGPGHRKPLYGADAERALAGGEPDSHGQESSRSEDRQLQSVFEFVDAAMSKAAADGKLTDENRSLLSQYLAGEEDETLRAVADEFGLKPGSANELIDQLAAPAPKELKDATPYKTQATPQDDPEFAEYKRLTLKGLSQLSNEEKRRRDTLLRSLRERGVDTDLRPKDETPPTREQPKNLPTPKVETPEVKPAGEAVAHLDKVLSVSKNAGNQEAEIRRDLSSVVGRMPSGAQSRLKKNLRSVHFAATAKEYGDDMMKSLESPEFKEALDKYWDAVAEQGAGKKWDEMNWFERTAIQAIKSGGKALATSLLKARLRQSVEKAAGTHISGSGRVSVNLAAVKGAGVSAKYVAAHELAHNIDNDELSSNPEWGEAFKSEIDRPASGTGQGGRLTNYARTDPSEAFAEFAAHAYTANDEELKNLERRFPKAAAYFKKNNLWPTG